MELVVAEKPSVARDLARVLGVRPAGKDAFEGTDHVITWCIGHLVELDEPAAYDPAWKPWRLDALPMVPREFRLRPSAHAAGHLRAVRALLRDRRFRGAINACDAGREGELIFRYVYQYAGARLPVRRLWISSMTDAAIRRGLAALRPAVDLDPLADAARSRSEADWLVGMNATRAVTVRNREGGHTSLYSIGRVQTPTLAMIVGREQEIQGFEPRAYWEVRAELATAEGRTFGAIWKHGPSTRLASLELASSIATRDREAVAPFAPVVERVRAKAVREPPPLLFDLTALQRTANRRFGFTATRTLELAQALYERHKILTYPRTDSRHLSDDLAGELPALFGALAAVPEYAPFVTPLLAALVDGTSRPRRVFDDSKVHDHHAIIPTGATVRMEALDRDERRLFDLVARRFVGAFHGDAEFAVTEAWIRVAAPAPGVPGASDPAPAMSTLANAAAAAPGVAPAASGEPVILEVAPPPPDRYFARGRVRTAAGWQAVAGIDEASSVRDDRARREGREGRDDREGREDADDAEARHLLPPLVEGQLLTGSFAARAKQTTPPARFSEATLLGAMESAGKAIDDEALRAAMKDSGLGTPATRAAIIETLLKRDFIVRERQHLLPTATGTSLIEALPVASLASPELTGAWEARLSRIARGEESRAAFMADIERYVRDLVAAIRNSTPAPPPANQPPPAWEVRGGGQRGAGDGRSGGSKRGSRKRDGASAPGRAPRSSARPSSAPRGASPSCAPVPLSSRMESQHDAAIIAALRASTQPGRTEFPDAPAPSHRPGDPSQPVQSSASPPIRDRAVPLTRDRAAPPARTPPPATPRLGARDHSGSPAERAGKPKRAPAELRCPRCTAGTLLTGSRGWGCSRWREGCRFVVWFEIAGKQLTTTQLRELVTKGATNKKLAGGAARLVLDVAGDPSVRVQRA
ncbi:MAG: DNA topoisomerase [Kofleriaceae bacterium]